MHELTLSMLEALGFLLRRRCLLIRREELCSVELLNLSMPGEENILTILKEQMCVFFLT